MEIIVKSDLDAETIGASVVIDVGQKTFEWQSEILRLFIHSIWPARKSRADGRISIRLDQVTKDNYQSPSLRSGDAFGTAFNICISPLVYRCCGYWAQLCHRTQAIFDELTCCFRQSCKRRLLRMVLRNSWARGTNG